MRRHTLRTRYGMTLEQFEEMWHSQGGKCANPGCDFTALLDMADRRQALEVDHDHATGKVRALLCPPCNRALGHVNDDPSKLTGLIAYIAAHR